LTAAMTRDRVESRWTVPSSPLASTSQGEDEAGQDQGRDEQK